MPYTQPPAQPPIVCTADAIQRAPAMRRTAKDDSAVVAGAVTIDGVPARGVPVGIGRTSRAITSTDGRFRLAIARRLLSDDSAATLSVFTNWQPPRRFIVRLAAGDSLNVVAQVCPTVDPSQATLQATTVSSLSSRPQVLDAMTSPEERWVFLEDFATAWRAAVIEDLRGRQFPPCREGSVRMRRVTVRDAEGRRGSGLFIKGRVRDLAGRPIDSATAFAREMGSPAMLDGGGIFHINLPIGRTDREDTVTVELRADGHASRAQPLAYASGDTIELDAVLCPQRADVAAAEQPTAARATHDDRRHPRSIVRRVAGMTVALERGTLRTSRVGSARQLSTLRVFGVRRDTLPVHDTLLVSGRRLTAVRYGHGRAPTEVEVAAISEHGMLRRIRSYQLRHERGTSHNELAWLAGSELAIYTAEWWPVDGVQSDDDARPTMTVVTQPARSPERSVPTSYRWFRMAEPFQLGPSYELHTVTTCDLGGAADRCIMRIVPATAATAVHPSARALDVWTDGRPSWVHYEIPLGASPPHARVQGANH